MIDPEHLNILKDVCRVRPKMDRKIPGGCVILANDEPLMAVMQEMELCGLMEVVAVNDLATKWAVTPHGRSFLVGSTPDPGRQLL